MKPNEFSIIKNEVKFSNFISLFFKALKLSLTNIDFIKFYAFITGCISAAGVVAYAIYGFIVANDINLMDVSMHFMGFFLTFPPNIIMPATIGLSIFLAVISLWFYAKFYIFMIAKVRSLVKKAMGLELNSHDQEAIKPNLFNKKSATRFVFLWTGITSILTALIPQNGEIAILFINLIFAVVFCYLWARLYFVAFIESSKNLTAINLIKISSLLTNGSKLKLIFAHMFIYFFQFLIWMLFIAASTALVSGSGQMFVMGISISIMLFILFISKLAYNCMLYYKVAGVDNGGMIRFESEQSDNNITA